MGSIRTAGYEAASMKYSAKPAYNSIPDPLHARVIVKEPTSSSGDTDLFSGNTDLLLRKAVFGQMQHCPTTTRCWGAATPDTAIEAAHQRSGPERERSEAVYPPHPMLVQMS